MSQGRDIAICDPIGTHQLKTTSYEELQRLNEKDIKEAVIKALDVDMQDYDMVLLFGLDNSNRLSPVMEYNADDMTTLNTIIAINMFKLGLTRLDGTRPYTRERFRDLHQVIRHFHVLCQHLRNATDEGNDAILWQIAQTCRICPFLEKNFTKYVNYNHEDIVAGDVFEINQRLLPHDQGISECRLVDNYQNLLKAFYKFMCEKLLKVMEISRKYSRWLMPNLGESVELDINGVAVRIESSIFDGIQRANLGPGLELIGRGGFASAYKYGFPNRQATVPMVIKELRRLERNTMLPSWLREFEHTRNLKHSNIIKLYGTPIIYKGVAYLVMEFGGVSLNKRYKNNSMPVKEVKKAMHSIASALKYLQNDIGGDEIIIHRDIRADNVVVAVTAQNESIYKLIDFGISTRRSVLDSAINTNVDCGNDFWKSPESLDPVNKKQSRKSDIWCFGIFSLELMSFLEKPKFMMEYLIEYHGIVDVAAKRYGEDLKENKVHPLDIGYLKSKRRDNDDDRIYDILHKCLQIEIEERVNSIKLLEYCEALLSDPLDVPSIEESSEITEEEEEEEDMEEEMSTLTLNSTI